MHSAPASQQPVPSSWRDAAERFAERIAVFISRWRYLLMALCTIGYALDTVYRAHRKLFWFDEIFTIYISRLPSLKPIWQALLQGADFNPPLLYVLTRLSQSVFRHGHVATRLPEAVGV